MREVEWIVSEFSDSFIFIGVTSMKLTRKEQGMATVEMAIVLLAFLGILFAIIEGSVVFYDKAVITGCSATLAQQEATAPSTAKPTQASLQSSLATVCPSSNLISLGSAGTTAVVLNADNNATTSASCTLPSMATGTNAGTSGNCVSVTVTYSYTGLGLGSSIQSFSGSGGPLSSTTVMYNQ
jgi:Flp pilus assembly protein TadG